MESFNINITLDDCCCNKCNTNNITITRNITSLTDFIPIQNSYNLKIIAVYPTYVVLSVDNGLIHFVRRAYINIPVRICLPNNCACHKLTININSITT